MDSMTTINDIVDFVRIIKEQPEWADTVRGILLGQELLDLPRQFAEFVQLTNANFSAVYERLDRLEGQVGNLIGAELERRVHGDIINIASRHLGLNRARILQSQIVARQPQLQDDIDDAEEQGLITEAQGSHLEQTDIIIAARRKSNREDVHVAIEISRAIGNDDITRARERAQTLAVITATPAIAAVVGGSISPSQEELADLLGVVAIISPRLSS